MDELSSLNIAPTDLENIELIIYAILCCNLHMIEMK